jgi:uncharacterized membrane protein YjjP (DUF1212 family)
MSRERPVSEFLALLTREWVAYGSEGVSLRADIHEIARAHGARAEIQLLADSATLTVHEGEHVDSIAVVSSQEITRLDRYAALRAIMARAKEPEADLEALAREIEAVADSPAPYPVWAKGLGIVLFVLGFSVNVQATWQQVGFAAVTGVLVALVVLTGDRVQRVSLLTPFLAAVIVSAVVLLLVDGPGTTSGALLLMIPALFFFIPGDILSASMFELADGRITSGSAQFVYSVFFLILLFLGVLMGAVLTGTPTSVLFGEAAPAEFPPIIGWLGWVVFALGFMLAFAVPMRFFGWVLLVTLVAFGAQQVGTFLFGELVGTYLAAALMMIAALLASRDPVRPPPMVLALSGFFVLTVGALGLEGLTAMVSGDAVSGYTDLLKMLTIAMAIALGLLTGAVIMRRATS